MGQLDEAKEYLLLNLKLIQDHYGKNSKDLIPIYTNLSSAYNKSRDYEKAIAYSKQAVVLAEEQYGINHPQTHLAILNLGITYHDGLDISNAKKYYEKAKPYLDTLGVSKSFLISICQRITQIYYIEKNFEEALFYIKKTSDLAQDSNDPVLLLRMKTLEGDILEKLSRDEEALASYQSTVDIVKQIKTDNYYIGPEALDRIGQIHLAHKRYSEAIKAYEDLVKLVEENKDYDRSLLQEYFEKLEQIHATLGNKSEAEKYNKLSKGKFN